MASKRTKRRIRNRQRQRERDRLGIPRGPRTQPKGTKGMPFSKGRRMSFKDAMDLVPDDLPDGAFFAMAHEMAELDYGDGFDELV